MKQVYLNADRGEYKLSLELSSHILDKTSYSVYIANTDTTHDAYLLSLQEKYGDRIDFGRKTSSSNSVVVKFRGGLPNRVVSDGNSVTIGVEYLKLGKREICSTDRLEQLKSDVEIRDKLVVFGSVWKHEMYILQYFVGDLLKDDYSILIAPRYLDYTNDFLQMLKSQGHNPGLRTHKDTFKDKNIIILDTLGELKDFYGLGSINVVCGGLDKSGRSGGHNPYESLVFEKPTIVGEDYSSHRFVVEKFMSTGFIQIVGGNTVVGLERAFDSIKSMQKSAHVVDKKKEVRNKLGECDLEFQKTIDEIIEHIEKNMIEVGSSFDYEQRRFSCM